MYYINHIRNLILDESLSAADRVLKLAAYTNEILGAYSDNCDKPGSVPADRIPTKKEMELRTMILSHLLWKRVGVPIDLWKEVCPVFLKGWLSFIDSEYESPDPCEKLPDVKAIYEACDKLEERWRADGTFTEDDFIRWQQGGT